MADTITVENPAPHPLAGYDLGALQDAVLTAMANVHVDMAHHGFERNDISVIPSVTTWTHPDIVVNELGQAMIVHENPMPDRIWWVEYDPEYAQVIFVTVKGQIMGLGMKIHPEIDMHLRRATSIYLVQIDENGAIVNLDERKIAVRTSIYSNK